MSRHEEAVPPHEDAAGPDSSPFDDIHEMSAQKLLHRSRRMIWLTLLPLLMLVLLLAAWQALAQWRRVTESASSEMRAQRFAFEVIARDASFHVADMRHWMQQEFMRGSADLDRAVADALKPRLSADGRPDGYTLDALPALLRNDVAQMIWPQNQGVPAPATVGRAQALSNIMAIAQQRNSNFAWSYFFGWPDRHLVMMPWVPSRALAEEQGGADMSSTVAAWYGYEVVTAGLPASNPTNEPYWTAPYLDAGGLGLLVSHAAPVVVADEVRGIVGADVKLSTLEVLLDKLPGAPWRAWVVDDAGHVLADRQRHVAVPMPPPLGASAAASAAAPVPMQAERLPAEIDRAAVLRAIDAHGSAIEVGQQRLIAIGIARAPWTVVLAAPESALLLATLPYVLPYSLIALGLMAVWLVSQTLLRGRVVTPMLRVLGYLQRLSNDAATPEPRLSQRWQPWVRMITDTFADMRGAARRERIAEMLKSAIVDHAQNAVVVADVDDRVVEFNAAAEALLGCSRASAIGRPVCELICPDRFQPDYHQATRRMREGDPDQQMGRRLQRTVRRADGSELPVETVMWMVQTDDGTYLTISMSDLTPMNAAKDVIERQRDALRQSEKLTAMGSLLAGVAHELNNPLAIVMGRANLLEDKTEGSPLHDDAVRIREAAERCGRIVRTFLNMARSRPAQRAPVRLNDLVRAAAEMLGYTLRSHGIQVELQLGTSLPEAQLDGDQIGQVVLNLIVNAQQALAAHEGKRHILVRSGMDEALGVGVPTVWLSVADSGPGVVVEVRERIFDPFFTTKAEGMGTGLGLSVSRAIVREHGGELLLDDSPLGGACFRLLLPVLAPVSTSSEPTAQLLPAPESHLRVLVVDDEPEIAELLRDMLEGGGFTVSSAGSGAAALALLSTGRFDAIVSDLRMPDMDGAALWRAVCEHDAALSRRMLFVTGDTLSPDARQFLAQSACASLDKPFSKPDLLQRLHALLAG